VHRGSGRVPASLLRRQGGLGRLGAAHTVLHGRGRRQPRAGRRQRQRAHRATQLGPGVRPLHPRLPRTAPAVSGQLGGPSVRRRVQQRQHQGLPVRLPGQVNRRATPPTCARAFNVPSVFLPELRSVQICSREPTMCTLCPQKSEPLNVLQ